MLVWYGRGRAAERSVEREMRVVRGWGSRTTRNGWSLLDECCHVEVVFEEQYPDLVAIDSSGTLTGSVHDFCKLR